MMYKELQDKIEKDIIGKHDNDTLREVTQYIKQRIEDIEKQLKEEQMIQERTEIINEELQELNDYSYNSIINMVEMSYILSQKIEINKFNKLLDYTDDGINLYGLFVKFLFDKYYETNDTDMSFFIDNNLDECMNLFIKKFFLNATYEFCPYCEKDVLIPTVGGYCDTCGVWLKPCSLCNMDEVNCNKCKWEVGKNG